MPETPSWTSTYCCSAAAKVCAHVHMTIPPLFGSHDWPAYDIARVNSDYKQLFWDNCQNKVYLIRLNQNKVILKPSKKRAPRPVSGP